MSFFDNLKMFGLIAMIVGVISLALGVYSGFESGSVGTAAGAIGGLMILVLGLLVYFGKFDSKPEVVSGYLLIYGLGYVLMGIMQYDELLTCILYVIVGILAIFIGYTMYSGGKSSPIWWYLLVIIFLLLILINFIGMFGRDFGEIEGILGAVSSLLLVIVNLYMFMFLLDKSVKSRFAL